MLDEKGVALLLFFGGFATYNSFLTNLDLLITEPASYHAGLFTASLLWLALAYWGVRVLFFSPKPVQCTLSPAYQSD